MKRKDKLGKIDIKATINEEKVIDIEMQLEKMKNFNKRTQYYGARLISEQLNKKDDYEEFKPVILINILNYNMLEVPEYCTKTVTVAEKHREYEVVKDVTYYFIELPKFRKSKPKLSNMLECWLALIDGEEELLKMAKEKEKIIEEADNEVEEILSEAVIKELNEYAFLAKLDQNSKMSEAKEEGISIGETREKIKIAKELYKEGMNIEKISKITGLSKDEIEKEINS